jgi:uncharacterized protein (DUF4415 family)
MTMTQETTYKTAKGRILTDADIEAIADEVATDELAEAIVKRRGRPALGEGPSHLVPVRLDTELLEQLRDRAHHDRRTNSEIIREALRNYLAS